MAEFDLNELPDQVEPSIPEDISEGFDVSQLPDKAETVIPEWNPVELPDLIKDDEEEIKNSMAMGAMYNVDPFSAFVTREELEANSLARKNMGDHLKSILRPVPALAAAGVIEAGAGFAGFVGADRTAFEWRRNVRIVEEQIMKEEPLERGSWSEAMRNAFTSIYTEAPAFAIGLLLKARALALIALGTQAGLQKGSKIQEKGLSKGTAFAGTVVTFSSEVLTEIIPFGAFADIVKKSPGVGKNLTRFFLGEQIGEQINTIVDSVVDLMTITPDMTWDEYLQRVVSTAKATLIQTMVMGGGAVAARAVIETGQMDEAIETMPEDVKATFDEVKKEASAKGADSLESEVRALNEIEKTEEGKAHLESVIAEPPPTIEEVFERIQTEDLTEEEIGQLFEEVSGIPELIDEIETGPVETIRQRLIDIGQTEEEATSNAALFDGFRVLAKRAGVSVEDLTAKFLPTISKEAITDEDRRAISDNPFLREQIIAEEILNEPTELVSIRESISTELEERRVADTIDADEIVQMEEAIKFLDEKAAGAVVFEQSLRDVPVFFSQLESVIDEKVSAKSPAQDILNLIKKGNVKAEEIKWSGIEEFLKDKKTVTKEEVLEFLAVNRIEVAETELGVGETANSDDVAQQMFGVNFDDLLTHEQTDVLKEIDTEAATKFSQYQLPGGENYKELLLTLPTEITESTKVAMEENIEEKRDLLEEGLLSEKEFNEVVDAIRSEGGKKDQFTSPHFDEPNILAHVRFNERTDDEGNKVLFIEELQSDWALEARKKGVKGLTSSEQVEFDELLKQDEALHEKTKGDISNELFAELTNERRPILTRLRELDDKQARGVPAAPFIQKNWHELALKRMLRYAAENDFDKVAWISGEQTADRYDLSKQIGVINWHKNENGDGKIRIDALTPDLSEQVLNETYDNSDLETVIGKELAKRINDNVGKTSEDGQVTRGTLSGVDLKVGGEWAFTLYDKVIPNFLKKYGKKWGAKVGESDVGIGDRTLEVKKVADDAGVQSFEVRTLDGTVLGTFKNPSEADAFKKENSADIKPQQSIPITPEMKKSVLEKGQPLFQGEKEAPRGRIKFAPTGINIELLKNADQSTFIHETGHLYFRIMKELSALETAAPELKQDFKSIEDWLGVTEEQNGEITKEQEEKFARGFESFLSEGKAPTAALRKAFQDFKKWLAQIYKSLLDLNVTLTDEVRGVMNRILADEGVEVAETEEIIPEVEEAVFEQASFNVSEVATEMIPETTTDLLPSKAEKGIYYTATTEELNDYLAKNGDGFLYRVTNIKAIDKGLDVGKPDYRHRFKDNKPRKTHALTTNFQDAKKHLDSLPDKEHTFIYRVLPEDLGDEFAIQIPSAREGEVVHVHSPQAIPTGLTDVIFRNNELLEVSPDDSRRTIDQRRTDRAAERPRAVGLRGVARPSGREVLEQAPKISNIRQLAKSLGGIDFNREQLKGELNKLKEDAPATKILINKKNQGVTLDGLLEAAIEINILSEGSTLDDVIRALEINLETSEAIEEEIAKEERIRKKLEAKEFDIGELRKAFVDASVKARKAFREGKNLGAVEEAQKLKNILARSRKIRLVRDYFSLTDADLKKISRKNPLLLSQYEFKLYIDDVRIRAAHLSEEKLQKAILIKLIHDKDLKRVDNYRRVSELPSITKMNVTQVKKFIELLEPFHEGDVFLSERELETVDRTDLEGIKTWREARTRLAKEIGVSIEDLQKIKVTEWDEYKWDTALAETNPFFKMVVTETTRKLLEAETRAHEIENEVFALARKSEKSRKRTFVEKAIPQDKQIIEYLETPIDERAQIVSEMTSEQIDLANYMESYYQISLDYLIKTKSLERGRQNYFTHIRKTFLEIVKDSGLRKGIKGVFKAYREDEAVFNILDDDTGNILPLEKFFQFAMQRTGGIDPSDNVIKAFLTYVNTLEKKIALDELIPKIDIYTQSITPQIFTPRGLEVDRSLKQFINKYINNRKGRRIRWVAKQGGKIDISLRAMRTFTTTLDLGLNILAGTSAFVGEKAVNFQLLGVEGYTKGFKRSHTKKGKALLKKYEVFIGRSAWEEFSVPGKAATERLMTGAFSLFHQASVQANKVFLLGSITEAEFNAGEISIERLAELKLELGRLRVVPGTKSLVGSTSAGSALVQYKTWAVPVLRTNLKNIQTMASNLRSKPIGEALTTKEARETYRMIGVTITAIIVYGFAIADDKDKSLSAQLLKRSFREVMTSLQSFDPKMWLGTPRIATFLSRLGANLHSLVRLEEYKNKPGLKGVAGLQRQFTPRVIKQFKSKEKRR